MIKTGKFITIDGIEGAGKTTQINAITNRLSERGIKHIITREPGGTSVGESIRQILLNSRNQVNDNTELLLMFAARSEHITQVIKPALADGLWVISDRFSDASFAYQGAGRGIEMKRISQLNQWLLADFKADVSFFLDIDVETAMVRIEKRPQKKDRIEQESLDFFKRVALCYQQLAKNEPERIHLIDGNQKPVTVFKKIQAVLDQL